MSRELRVHSVPTRAEHWRTVIEIAAIMAAGVWAIYTFVYEQRIKPLSEHASFTTPTTVEQGPRLGGIVFLTIHKGLQNTGNVPVAIAAETLTVYGERLRDRRSVRRRTTPLAAEVYDDVPRRPADVLYSFARLRNGAIGGSPMSNFMAPAHASTEEDTLLAVPLHLFPVVLISRKDYIARFPIGPKIGVKIVRDEQGAYDLQSVDASGEYDSAAEYAIRP